MSRNALRQHGSGAVETKRGQLPVDRMDYLRLPRIVGDPDLVQQSQSGSRGGPRVVLTKMIGGIRYRVVLEARVRRRQIAFLTMFKSRERF
jgi:phage-Barnase-EndoU-ColicinE5/D-RelE like nuclease3